MNRKDILNNLKKYDFNKDEFIILAGSALVLMGLKENTKDIDIAVSDRLYEYLLSKYKCDFQLNIDGYDIWFIDDIINFSNHLYDEVEYCVDENGYKVQTEESIMKIKKDNDWYKK